MSKFVSDECEHGEYEDECGHCEALKLRAHIAELEAALAKVTAAATAVVEAWEHDEIGQVDGDLIEQLAAAREVSK